MNSIPPYPGPEWTPATGWHSIQGFLQRRWPPSHLPILHQGNPYPSCSWDSKPPLLPFVLCHYPPLTLSWAAQEYLSAHPDASCPLPEPHHPDLGMMLQTMQPVNPTPIHFLSTLVVFHPPPPSPTHILAFASARGDLSTQASGQPVVGMCLSPPLVSSADRESQPTGVRLQDLWPQEEGRGSP